MRIAIALLTLLVSCASPRFPALARGVDALQTSNQADVVEFFRIHPTFESYCFECVLIDFVEGRTREAHYVSPQPSCRLTRLGVAHAELGEARGDVILQLVLNEKGLRSLRPCAPPEVDDDEDFITHRFLIVVAGRAAGTQFLSSGQLSGPNPLFSIRGGEDVRSLFHVLRPNRAPVRES